MNENKHIMNTDGLRKLRTLLDEQKIVMMASQLDKSPFSVCPMTLQQMDEKGDLWFFASMNSGLFKDIGSDNRVQIIYSDGKKEKYLSIFGNATHVIAEHKKEELWNANLLNWFMGKDDPNLALLNVNIQNSYYWDNQNSRLVSFFKMDKVVSPNEFTPNNKGFINL